MYAIRSYYVIDTLSCFDHYAFVGFSSSTAVIYDIYQGNRADITLNTTISNPKYGQPVIDAEVCYLPIFTWDSGSPTAYVILYPETKTSSELFTLSDTFYYLVGISDSLFYAESGDSYLTFPIQQCVITSYSIHYTKLYDCCRKL